MSVKQRQPITHSLVTFRQQGISWSDSTDNGCGSSWRPDTCRRADIGTPSASACYGERNPGTSKQPIIRQNRIYTTKANKIQTLSIRYKYIISKRTLKFNIKIMIDKDAERYVGDKVAPQSMLNIVVNIMEITTLS